MINEGKAKGKSIEASGTTHVDLKWFQDFLCINFKDQIYYDNMCLVANQPALYFITAKTHKSKAIEKISVDQLKLCPIIPESGCARKETVDIDILVTSRNGNRKIMQSIRITSRSPLRIRKWNQLSIHFR